MEDWLEQPTSDPLTLTRGLHTDEGEVPVGLRRMARTELVEQRRDVEHPLRIEPSREPPIDVRATDGLERRNDALGWGPDDDPDELPTVPGPVDVPPIDVLPDDRSEEGRMSLVRPWTAQEMSDDWVVRKCSDEQPSALRYRTRWKLSELESHERDV